VVAPAFLKELVLGQKHPVLGDRPGDLSHTLAGRRDGPEYRWHPPERRVSEQEHRFDLLHRHVAAIPVGLVDHEDLTNLHESSLHCLDAVAGFRHEHYDRGVGGPGDIQFRLSDADRLEDDVVETRRVHHRRDARSGAGQSAQSTTGRHAANEDAFPDPQTLHANAVAQKRAASEGAGRIDGDDPDGASLIQEVLGQAIDERALSRTGRPRDPYAVGPPNVRIDDVEEFQAARVLVLYPGNGPRQCERVATLQSLDQLRDACAPQCSPMSTGAGRRLKLDALSCFNPGVVVMLDIQHLTDEIRCPHDIRVSRAACQN